MHKLRERLEQAKTLVSAKQIRGGEEEEKGTSDPKPLEVGDGRRLVRKADVYSLGGET